MISRVERAYPKVAMLSLWRDDAKRDIENRARHLLSKSYPALRWIWVVGDSDDDTYQRLLAIINEVAPWRHVDLLRHTTEFRGADVVARRRRLSASANFGLSLLRPDDDYLLMHESDLRSPLNLVEIFLGHAQAGRCPIAGWPILPINGNQAVFYDIWAYRSNGVMFTNAPPYSPVYRADAPFEVDSFGSCWLAAADDMRDTRIRFGEMAVLDVCAQLRERGRQLWVDPKLTIIQPPALWVPHPTD
jgi:hypothetical protein